MVLLLLLLLLLAAAEASASPDAVSAASAQLAREGRPFRIGLIELSDVQRVEFLTARTIKHLKAASPVPIEIQTFTSRELESAVREKRVDAFIASSRFYWRMIPFGARDIATMISPNRPDPNHSSAITFITASRNPVIRTLEDLRGARLSASYPTAFMGYRIGLAEIAAEGYDPDNFFSSVTFTQSPEIDAIAGKVLTGEADAAFVQSCWLETQPASVRNKFRVIAPREDPSYPCLHSTHTYPNVTVAVLQGAAPGAAREIARLLQAPEARTLFVPSRMEREALDRRPQALDRRGALLPCAPHCAQLRRIDARAAPHGGASESGGGKRGYPRAPGSLERPHGAHPQGEPREPALQHDRP